jgi:hypothetical protein
MAWTYSDAPGTGSAAALRDAVRLAIGDTDTTDQQITDAGIAWFLDQADDSVNGAARFAVKALWAKYSRQADTSHGKLKVSASQRAKAYKDLLDTMERENSYSAEMFVGGITISGNEDLASDTDAIQPTFEVGAFDSPGTSTGSRWGNEEG